MSTICYDLSPIFWDELVNGSWNLEDILILYMLMSYHHNLNLKVIFRDVVEATCNSLHLLLEYHEEIHSVFLCLILIPKRYTANDLEWPQVTLDEVNEKNHSK